MWTKLKSWFGWGQPPTPPRNYDDEFYQPLEAVEDAQKTVEALNEALTQAHRVNQENYRAMTNYLAALVMHGGGRVVMREDVLLLAMGQENLLIDIKRDGGNVTFELLDGPPEPQFEEDME